MFAKEKNNGEGKGKKWLEEVNIFCRGQERRREERRKIYFLQRKRKTEKEKAGNIRRRNISFFAEEKKTKNEKEENIWRKNIYFFAEEKKKREGKYLKKENIFFGRGKEKQSSKRRKIYFLKG